ncbi:hypothetical protein N7462_007985, partial [Penicillium macrosclerotiorum]|uniref:uncharacterized protein n=1 Tax=Penicillium macrosclerotiorum TaxID=303699 RepID=UPI002546FD3F
MKFTEEPYVKSLNGRGYVQGVIHSKENTPVCLSFTGVRYAFQTKRWERATPLPKSFTYGTKEEPARCDMGSKVYPQLEWDGGFKEDSWSEDCFQVNIWVPSEEPPACGWPVLVFLHGGWLQSGTPNDFKPSALISEGFKAIFILPAYRLGVFGFFYCTQLEEETGDTSNTVGNLGFWDQRLALEWVSENISLFGGNSDNITLAGYSAGAYSAFHQLAYELNLCNSNIIKRVCMWSNGPGVQPKTRHQAQLQSEELAAALNIPPVSPRETLEKLRNIPSKELLTAALSIHTHQFRPITDGAFIRSGLIQNLDEFARQLIERRVPLMIGECKDEHYLYGLWKPPKEDSREGLRERLIADYPAQIVNGLMNIYTPTETLPSRFNNWVHAFAVIYADMQVHKLQRGLVKTIAQEGGEELLYRYRIEFRMKCVDQFLPPEAGVTH